MNPEADPDNTEVTADVLLSDSVDSLKELERVNRDTGASNYLQTLEAQLGTFQMRAEEQTVLQYLSPRHGESLLDAGAGVGRFALLVAPQVARLFCIDLSPISLDILVKEAQARGVSNIEVTVGDLCNLQKSGAQFDKAYAIGVIQHIPSQRGRLTAVRNIFEMLCPGGECLITAVSWNSRNRTPGLQKEGFWGKGERRLYRFYFARNELRSLMEEAGFVDIRLRGLIVLPRRLTNLLPPSWASLEAWASRLSFSTATGRDLIAIGRKPQ